MAFALSQKIVGARSLRERRILNWLFIGVVSLHVIVLGILGSIVIFRHIFKREVALTAAPEVIKKIEPRKLEHKVKVQKQQQKSGRPKLQPRLSAQKVAEFSLPELKAEAAPKLDPLKSTIRSFGESGIGTGMAGGKGLGGLGLGVSQVRFMGFNVQTERVAVLIDLSPSMVEDERGGFDGYEALKDEIKQMVKSLNSGSLFNLIAFDGAVDIYSREALRASKENKETAATWINPYMTDRVNVEKNGTRLKNYTPLPNSPLMKATGGPTRYDLAFLAAFESGVDTIFIVSDGVHYILREPTKEELEDLERRQKAVTESQRKAWAREVEKKKKEWDEMNKRRAKRGLHAKVIEGHGFGAGPGLNLRIGDKDVLDYLVSAAKEIYGAKGLPLPKIYCVGYVTTPEKEQFLKDLASAFKGRFRRSKTLVKPIKFE